MNKWASAQVYIVWKTWYKKIASTCSIGWINFVRIWAVCKKQSVKLIDGLSILILTVCAQTRDFNFMLLLPVRTCLLFALMREPVAFVRCSAAEKVSLWIMPHAHSSLWMFNSARVLYAAYRAAQNLFQALSAPTSLEMRICFTFFIFGKWQTATILQNKLSNYIIILFLTY